MLKGRELQGLSVYVGNLREEIGRVSDVFVDERSGAITGFAIAVAGLWQRYLYVELRHVREISKNGLIVPNKKSIKKVPKNSQSLGQKGWLGSRLVDSQGQDRGTVADILVKNGAVAGLEISAGLLNDLQNRRDFLPWQHVNPQNGIFITGDDIHF